jgi:hypothetical protein
MSNQPKHLIDEADVGSGDKTPADHETEQLIKEVGKAKKHADAQRGIKQGEDNQQNAAPAQNHSL